MHGNPNLIQARPFKIRPGSRSSVISTSVIRLESDRSACAYPRRVDRRSPESFRLRAAEDESLRSLWQMLAIGRSGERSTPAPLMPPASTQAEMNLHGWGPAQECAPFINGLQHEIERRFGLSRLTRRAR